MTCPRRVLACVLAAALAGASAARAEDAAPLRGPAAWSKLVGNTVVAKTKTGAVYTDFYLPDGTVRHRDGDGAAAGRWIPDGDGVCFDYPDDDERTCVTVTVSGTTGTFTDPDGTVDAFDILSGNAKDL